MLKDLPEIFYYVGLPFIATITWITKLDSKVNKAAEDRKELTQKMKDHEEQDDDIHSKLMDTLSTIREDLSEIKGFLKRRQ